MTHFTVLLVLAALAAAATLAVLARRSGESVRGLAVPVLILATSALVGAKAYALWLRYDGSWMSVPSFDTPGSFAGFRHAGGMLGLLAGMALLAVIPAQRERLPRLADWSAIAVCAASAVFRINCHLDGCCAGSTCTAGWCQLLGGPARHPLALYFLVWAAAMGLLLLWCERRKHFDGQVALLYLAIHETGKVALESLRLPEVALLRQPSIAMAFVAVLLLLWALHRRTRGRVVTTAAATASLLLALAAPPLAARASAAPATQALTVAGGRVSGHVTDTPAADAVAAIARLAGAELIGRPRGVAPVTLELADEPIEDVLPRLLERQGFDLVYRKDGSVRRITVHDDGEPEAPRAATTSPAPTFSLPPPPARMLAYRMRVNHSGPLADMVGRGDVSVADLMHFALRHDDPLVRADAVRTGLQSLSRIPGARAWLRDTFAAVAGHPLAAVRAAMDPVAREALSGVVTSGRGRLQSDASEILGEDAPE